MRIILRILFGLLVCLAVMNAHFVCSCQKSFDSRRALSVHEAACTSRKDQVQNMLTKRKLMQTKTRAAKLRQREGAKSAQEQREDLRDGELGDFDAEPMVCPMLQYFLLNETNTSIKAAILAAAESTPPAIAESTPPVEAEPAAETSNAVPSSSGRPTRARRLPKALADYLPSSVSALRRTTRQRRPPDDPSTSNPLGTASASPDDQRNADSSAGPSSENPQTPSVVEEVPAPAVATYEDREVDGFGLYRSYFIPPKVKPDDASSDEPCSAPTFDTAPPVPRSNTWKDLGSAAVRAAADTVYAPFRNATTFYLMEWWNSGGDRKSVAELDRLVKVITAKDFDKDDLQDFSAAEAAKRLDEASDHISSADGWHCTSVKIPLPGEGAQRTSEANAHTFDVPGFHYRKIMDIVKSAFKDASSKAFTMVPYRLWWRSPHASPDEPPERVYSEIYNSNAMVNEYETLATRAQNMGEKLEIAIAAIMLWSDSTHLASFGNASLWPIYLFFGNQSKYERCQPSFFAAHHLAYIPSVSV